MISTDFGDRQKANKRIGRVVNEVFQQVKNGNSGCWHLNVDGSWSMKIGGDANDNVTVLADLPVSKRTGNTMGLRSSMMGDRFEIDGVEYKVAMMGFKKVEKVAA